MKVRLIFICAPNNSDYGTIDVDLRLIQIFRIVEKRFVRTTTAPTRYKLCTKKSIFLSNFEWWNPESIHQINVPAQCFFSLSRRFAIVTTMTQKSQIAMNASKIWRMSKFSRMKAMWIKTNKVYLADGYRSVEGSCSPLDDWTHCARHRIAFVNIINWEFSETLRTHTPWAHFPAP